MKKVFTNSYDVIHLFAQRHQDEARCPNVFFNGDKIYSYGRHYLLGEFVTNPKGERAIIIDDRGYSVTTSKHISQLTGATRQYKQFFTSDIDLKQVLYTVESNIKKLPTARKKELYITPSLLVWGKLNEYIEWSGKKDMKKDDMYKKIKKFIGIMQSDDLNIYMQKQKKIIEADRKKEQEKRAKELKENVAKFYDYEISKIYGIDEDFIRVSKDGLKVETSQYVTVDAKDALTLYKMIVAGVDIKGHKIGYYKVTSINGTLTIGCHHINIESMHRCGKQLLQSLS